MNTKKIKEIGKWMMIIGSSIFTAGAGCYWAASHVERKEDKLIHERKMHQIEEEERAKVLKLKEEKLKAETEKDHAYCLKINQMDDEAFAKYHAEQIAKANDTVIKDAERTKKDAEAEIVKVRLETKEKINRIREECLKKVEVADKKRDDALEKYDAINTLFTNKDEILRAKEALDAAVEKDKRNKEDRDELLESIKAMLED